MILLLPFLLFFSRSHATETNPLFVSANTTLLRKIVDMEKAELLGRLGIPTEETQTNGTVPPYLEDLYKQLNSVNSSDNTDNLTDSGAGKDADLARSVDTIESLVNRDCREESSHLRQHLIFRTPSIASEDDVTSAHLRLFRTAPENGSGVVVARAKVYLVLKIAGGQQLQLLDVVDLFDMGGEHWVVFEVKGAASEWLRNPGSNFELELHAELRDKTLVPPASVGLKKWVNDAKKGGLIVLFRNGDESSAEIVSRMKRTHHVSQQRLTNDLPLLWSQSRLDLKRERTCCQKRDFYIDFKLLKWVNVLRPKGYRASICSGVCPFLLTNNMNATNHARIQNMMHHKNPDKYPPIACVPVDLAPLIILYRTEEGSYRLKRMLDMVAVRCGCH